MLRLSGELVDHGASVMLPLLLPDAPVVAWWPVAEPAVPAEDPIGALAQRRITDAASSGRPHATLLEREKSYQPGDTDLAWTRLTLWRGLLASTLDQPPYETITSAVVAGASDSPSTDLLAGWLAMRLKCPGHPPQDQGRCRDAERHADPEVRRHHAQPRRGQHRHPLHPGPARPAALAAPARTARLHRRGAAPAGRRRGLPRGAGQGPPAGPAQRPQGHRAGGRTRRTRAPALPSPLETDGADPESTSKPKRPPTETSDAGAGSREPAAGPAADLGRRGCRRRRPGWSPGSSTCSPAGRIPSVVLTGGTIGHRPAGPRSGSPRSRDAVDWRRVEIFWGDERFVPADDPASATSCRPGRRCWTMCRSTRRGCTRWPRRTARSATTSTPPLRPTPTWSTGTALST